MTLDWWRRSHCHAQLLRFISERMGSFLDKPITEKHVEDVQANGLRAGAAAMQGWRVTMEDAHTMVESIDGAPDHAFFAVYDGHGGDKTAIAAGRDVLGLVLQTTQWKQYMQLADKSTSDAAELAGSAVRAAFLDLDKQLKAADPLTEDQSGCTAIAAIVSPTHTIVANCGDSRSILAKGGRVEPMSFDHKPTNPSEKQRIEAAGGHVSMKRVNGDLAVSRALGDFSYKQRDDLPAEEQQVSGEADIKIEPRDGSEEFLVLACDGIWDVVSNDDCGVYVRQVLKNFEAPERMVSWAARDLLDNCLVKNSRDNMSAVVVCFTAEAGAKGGACTYIGVEPKPWANQLVDEIYQEGAGGR